jgi:dihydrolipoamide dehydrogenase
MSEFDYDVLVIGAGPGGYVAAIRAAQLGLKTACVEMRPTLGGTCLNVGCIPSKALLHASELFEEVGSRKLSDLGIGVSRPSLDLDKMHSSRAKVVKDLTDGIAFLFKKNKVEWLTGQASFVDSSTVAVGEAHYRARNIVIATGSSVTPLPGVAIDGVRIVDSTGALELPEVPDHLVVIGGGAIGLELGSVWRRLGAKVTVIEYLEDILPDMDDDIRKEARRLLTAQGMVIRTGAKVIEAALAEEGVALTVESAEIPAEKMTADVVLVAVGRRANTEGLNLDKAGILLDERGRIVVNHDLRSQVKGIYAIGDVIPGPMLAHRAEDEGIAVAEIIAGRPGTVNHAVIPSVVYTKPEIASVGLTEAQAASIGPTKVGTFPLFANSRAKANHDGTGFVKVVTDAKNDRILGVHIIASVAGTMIAQAAQAMEFGATSEDIAYTCHAHPTHSEALKEAALAVRGKPIHA